MNRPATHPASLGQRLLWLLDRHRGGDGGLNCPLVCEVEGVEPGVLRSGVDLLGARHESLRSRFVGRGRALTVTIADGPQTPFEVVNVGERAEAHRALRAELATPFNSHDHPSRATLWRTPEGPDVFCLNMHHSVTDAWSCGVLFRDFADFLRSHETGAPPPPRSGWTFSEFAAWQSEILRRGGFDRHRSYWREVVADHQPCDLLPGSGDVTQERRPSRASTSISDLTRRRVSRLAGVLRTIPLAVTLAAFYALLRKRTGKDDLTVASVFANRSRPELRHTVGFLASTVLLRTPVPESLTFTDLVRATHQTVMSASVFQGFPVQLLPAPDRDDSSRRLDDVVFQMMPPVLPAQRTGRSRVQALIPEGVGCRFETELVIVPIEEGYRAILFFNAARTTQEWGDALLADYGRVLDHCLKEPQARMTESP